MPLSLYLRDKIYFSMLRVSMSALSIPIIQPD